MCKCNGSAVEYTVGDHESSSTGGGSPQSDIKEAIIKLCGGYIKYINYNYFSMYFIDFNELIK